MTFTAGRLFGKANRTAADASTSESFVPGDLGRKAVDVLEVADALGLPLEDIRTFTWSANNLSARDGGGHALQARLGTPPIEGRRVVVGREAQRFAGELLGAWMKV